MADIFRHLTRKKYLEAMEITEYGWNPQGFFSHVTCPSDLEFISESDEEGECNCSPADCKSCWESILKKKWGSY